MPTTTENLTVPVIFGFLAFASKVPTVRKPDRSTGGLHEGEFSGGPCSRFGDVHWVYEGTRETRNGDPDRGRG